MSLFGLPELWFHHVESLSLLFLELAVMGLRVKLLNVWFGAKHFVGCFTRWPVHPIRVFCFLFEEDYVRRIHLKLVLIVEIDFCPDGGTNATLYRIAVFCSIVKGKLISDGLGFAGSIEIIILLGHDASSGFIVAI